MIIDLSKINFGGGGGSKIKVQDVKVVTQNVDSSGAYDFQPDEGYDAMKVLRANLTIPTTPVQSIDLKIGIKFSNSTFSAMPYTLICDSGVTNMRSMFSNCENLTTLDVSSFDTINVTDMNGLFYSCYSLKTLDVSNFDTSKVTDMSYMFYVCNSLTALDLSNFNTSKVTDMNFMLSGSYNLTSLDLSNFNTINVNYMTNMFYNCNKLTTVKVINCDETTKNKILTRLQTDLSSYTWTLGDDGIIRRSETT